MKLEKNKKFLVCLDSLLAGANFTLGLNQVLDYTNMKALVVQEYLAKSPELTEQTYQAAKEASEMVSSGNFWGGFFSFSIAGIMGGLAVYESCKKD